MALPSRTRVLLATSTGSHWVMSGFESALGAALLQRCASVDVLLCDGVLPACQECDVRLFPGRSFLRTGPSPLCTTCFAPARRMFEELGVRVFGYGEFLDASEVAAATDFARTAAEQHIDHVEYCGAAVGEHAVAGALRYFGRGDLEEEPSGRAVAGRFLEAAALTAAAVNRILHEREYDVAVFHHGIYVPQGVIGDVCRRNGVRVVNWQPAYRNQTYLFSHGDTYHRTMIEEPVSSWETAEWNDDRETTLMDYLESRRSGGNDWISFQKEDMDLEEAFAGLAVDQTRPIIGLLTNVMWDAQIHFRANAFQSLTDWLQFTIEHFSKRTDGVQLLIRVHPAEVYGTVPSRQRAVDEIRSRWPKLPPNVVVVGPESPRNTYALMRACDTVLVYGTKMAVELPCWGIPVIVAGEAWARGKGFTEDIETPGDYGQALAKLPRGRGMEAPSIERARKYAYHLFFRRMIPVRFARRNRFLVPFVYDIRAMSDLEPGADPGLDTICRGILDNTPFIHDA